MPALTWNEVQDWMRKAHEIFCIENLQFQTFIESGTYLGDTVFAMKPYFRDLHTMEISSMYYEKAIQRFKHQSSIHCYQGDSAEILEKILPSLSSKPLLFWLDAHWSMGNTEFKDVHVPLLKELQVIVESSSNISLVIIDDVRLFGKQDHDVDWTPITREIVLEQVKSRLISYWYAPSHLDKEDRMILLLK